MVTVIRDADKANQDKIAVHLFCVYLSCDRNNMKSLQRQIHFNVINHWGPTLTLYRGLTVVYYQIGTTTKAELGISGLLLLLLFHAYQGYKTLCMKTSAEQVGSKRNLQYQ